MRILVFLLALLAAPASAAEVACLTSVAGSARTLVYDPDEPNVRANISLREKTFGGQDGIECPGFVTLSALLHDLNPGITYTQMAPFCLRYDAELKTYTGVDVGRRDPRLNCKAPGRSLCQRVNETRDSALAVAGLGTKVVNGLNTAAATAGVTATIAASADAVIVSGPASYLSGAFASLGATALSVLTAPATLTATAVTVVVIGGAVYACSE